MAGEEQLEDIALSTRGGGQAGAVEGRDGWRGEVG